MSYMLYVEYALCRVFAIFSVIDRHADSVPRLKEIKEISNLNIYIVAKSFESENDNFAASKILI